MAWWDHEELKPLEYRSARYFNTFRAEYSKNDEKKWHEINGRKDKPMSDKEMFDMTWNKPWTRATEENWAGDVKELYKQHGWDPTGTYSLSTEVNFQRKDRVIPLNAKFKEHMYLREVEDYIASTYGEHYAGEIQSFEKIASIGHGDGFALGNIDKLVSRYGKKNGYNRTDLLKIIHYGILMLWVHDKAQRDNFKQGDNNVK